MTLLDPFSDSGLRGEGNRNSRGETGSSIGSRVWMGPKSLLLLLIIINLFLLLLSVDTYELFASSSSSFSLIFFFFFTYNIIHTYLVFASQKMAYVYIKLIDLYENGRADSSILSGTAIFFSFFLTEYFTPYTYIPKKQKKKIQIQGQHA